MDIKNMVRPDQLDKLIVEIEGRLNDFEGGESDKEETIKSFAILIGNIAKNVAKGELEKIIGEWADHLSSEAYIGIQARLTNLNEDNIKP